MLTRHTASPSTTMVSKMDYLDFDEIDDYEPEKSFLERAFDGYDDEDEDIEDDVSPLLDDEDILELDDEGLA